MNGFERVGETHPQKQKRVYATMQYVSAGAWVAASWVRFLRFLADGSAIAEYDVAGTSEIAGTSENVFQSNFGMLWRS